MIAHPMDDQQNPNIPDENQEQTAKISDFSIDHILNRAGSSTSCIRNSENPKSCDEAEGMKFRWMQCSRYCPPRVPRVQKKDIQKRQLGRHPRIPFTSYQLALLEQKFKESPYLSSEEVILMSQKLDLADIRVKIWFQNRRARERRERNGVMGDFRTKDETTTTLVGASDEKFTIIHYERDDSSENRPNHEALAASVKSEISTSPLDFPTSFLNPFTRNVTENFQSNCMPNPYFVTGLSVFLPHVNSSKKKDDNS